VIRENLRRKGESKPARGRKKTKRHKGRKGEFLHPTGTRQKRGRIPSSQVEGKWKEEAPSVPGGLERMEREEGIVF